MASSQACVHSMVTWCIDHRSIANPTRKWAHVVIPSVIVDSSHLAWASHMESSGCCSFRSLPLHQQAEDQLSREVSVDQTQPWKLPLHYYTASDTHAACEQRADPRFMCCFLAKQASSHKDTGCHGSATFSANARSLKLTVKTSSLKCWDINILDTLLYLQNGISHPAQRYS